MEFDVRKIIKSLHSKLIGIEAVNTPPDINLAQDQTTTKGMVELRIGMTPEEVYPNDKWAQDALYQAWRTGKPTSAGRPDDDSQ
jgi:hypothetical protein